MLNKHYVMNAILFSAILLFSVSAQSIQIPADSVKGPVCVVTDSVHKVAIPLPPKKSTYNVILTDGLAQITLTQLFVNDYGVVNNIVYVFPLPHQAAVHAMSMEYRGKLFKAEIYEKQEAQQKYDSIVKTGGNAALLLQDRPNVFQQRLANIAVGDSAWVQIKCTMPLEYDNGTYELAIPAMVAERFQSENAGTVISSGRLWNPPADRDGATLQINVLLQTDFPVTQIQSPTHPVSVSSIESVRSELEARGVIGSETKLSMPYISGTLLQQVNTYPNKDFVLRFSRSAAEMDFALNSYYDTTRGAGYFYGSVFPDTALFSGEREKLDIVMLVDISGSQNGWPIAKEKEIANVILGKLQPVDRLTVLSFNDNVTWCFGEELAVNATNDNIKKAGTFINGLVSSGGTNLLNGVQSALNVAPLEGSQRFFIFLTDGFITNESEIINTIRTHSSSPTIFTFGAGGNLNRYFLDEAAKAGNGVSTEITQNEEVVPVVDEVWNKIESPQLSDVQVSCSGFDMEQLLLPDGLMLYKGSPLELFGMYGKGGTQTITISGIRNGEPVTFKKDIVLADAPNGNTMIPQVWAKYMINKLRVEEESGSANKTRIIELSKQYQVLSDYTAFLAISPVEQTKDQPLVKVDAPKVSHLMNTVSVKIINRQLVIDAPDDIMLQEIAVYDLNGCCLLRTTLQKAMKGRSVLWDCLLGSGKRIAQGHYILKIRTTNGVITKSLFLR